MTVSAAFSARRRLRRREAAGGSGRTFDKVSVAYRGAVVLKPLTLEVAAGEILALIGPSGSGKTTALRAVAGFVRPPPGASTSAGPTSPTCRPTSAASAWWCRTTRCFRTCASRRTSPSA